MVEKARIVKSLGETKLALPDLVNAGLAANDQVKYLFTLLQSAKTRADHPDLACSTLSAERLQAGIDDAALDEVVGTATAVAGGYRIDGAARIVEQAYAAVARMLAVSVVRRAGLWKMNPGVPP